MWQLLTHSFMHPWLVDEGLELPRRIVFDLLDRLKSLCTNKQLLLEEHKQSQRAISIESGVWKVPYWCLIRSVYFLLTIWSAKTMLTNGGLMFKNNNTKLQFHTILFIIKENYKNRKSILALFNWIECLQRTLAN